MPFQAEEASAVSMANKLRNRFRMGKGRAKAKVGRMGKGRVRAKVGRATGGPYLEMKGQRQRVGGTARQLSEQVKWA